ncbi:MAG: alpha/beta fold hydrolase [Bacteroidota bacterium]
MSNTNAEAEKKGKGAGCLRWLGRAALGMVMLLLGAAAVGAIYQAAATARDAKTYKLADQMVEVNGTQMRLDCRGSGRPTVVLEAGGQSSGTVWVWVQDEVAKFTRVCSYDRAGSGWSNPIQEELSPRKAAEMLHVLLENGGEQPPYLMVGHSLGGIFIRAFTAEYPDDVVGMVLVDSSHDNQAELIPSEFRNSPEWAQAQKGYATTFRMYQIAERLGVMRAFKLYDPALASYHLPEKGQQAMLAEMYRTGYWAGVARETEMINAYQSQPRTLNSLGDLPLIVLSVEIDPQVIYQSYPASFQPKLTPEMLQEQVDAFSGLQDELAALSSRSQHIVVDGEESGHNVQLDAPELVIDAIREVFGQAAG